MKKLRRWAIRLIIAIPFIIGTAWLIENYRGYNQWEEAQERAAKLGVSLKLDDYAAPSIPDLENLLKNPDFAREWNGEIEPLLNRWASLELDVPDPEGLYHGSEEFLDYLQAFPDESDPKVAVEKLTIATQKIESRLNKLAETILSTSQQDLSSRYEAPGDVIKTMNELESLQRLAGSFQDQAILSLHRNESHLALRNCEVIDRLAQNFKSPDLGNLVLTTRSRTGILVVIREGILLKAWDSPQIERLSKLLTTDVDHMFLANTLSYEAAKVPPSVDHADEIQQLFDTHLNNVFGIDTEEPPSTKKKIQHWIFYDGPKGWKQSRKAFAVNAILDQIESSSEWKWNDGDHDVAHRDTANEDSFSFDPLTLYRDTGKTISQLIPVLFEQAASNRLCLLALEIEKHRLATESYPSSRDELPQTSSIIDPCDPRKRPFSYKLLPKGGFQIYSKFFSEQESDKERNRFLWEFPSKN